MTEAFLTRREVAKLLRLSPAQFRDTRAELEAKGFPASTFGTGQRERWDPFAIDAWRRRNAGETPADDGGALSTDALLDRRAEALAAGRLQ